MDLKVKFTFLGCVFFLLQVALGASDDECDERPVKQRVTFRPPTPPCVVTASSKTVLPPISHGASSIPSPSRDSHVAFQLEVPAQIVGPKPKPRPNTAKPIRLPPIKKED